MYLHLRSQVQTELISILPLWRVFHQGQYLGEMRALAADTALTEFARETGITYFDLDAVEVDE